MPRTRGGRGLTSHLKMSAQDFIDDLAQYMDARTARDAACSLTGERAATKDDALDALEDMLMSAGSAPHLEAIVRAILSRCAAADLHVWVDRQLEVRVRRASDAIEAIVIAYL